MIPANLLPSDLRPYAFIAGGYAVNPASASDMDVWVTVSADDDIQAEIRRVRQHLRGEFGARFKREDTSYGSVAEVGDLYPNTLTFKVGKVERRGTKGIDIHVMVTTGGVLDIINDFDLSISQVAILPDGSVVKGSRWTPVTEPIQVVGEMRATQDRLAKYKERFNLQEAA